MQIKKKVTRIIKHIFTIPKFKKVLEITIYTDTLDTKIINQTETLFKTKNSKQSHNLHILYKI